MFLSWPPLRNIRDTIKRVNRCLGAAGELRRDMNELVDGPEIQRKLAKRPAGAARQSLHQLQRGVRNGGPPIRGDSEFALRI